MQAQNVLPKNLLNEENIIRYMVSEKPTNIKAPRVVRVVIPASVANNMQQLQKAINNSLVSILGKYGCSGCCSGIDIYFANETEFVVNPESLQPTGIAEAGM